MRTTLTLDDDVAVQLERLRKARHANLKDLVNEALRLAADRKRAELDTAMDELAELVRTLPVQDRANAW